MTQLENIQLENGFYLAPVATDNDIETLRIVNEEIWYGYFPQILPEGQTEYMLEKFYTPDAIKEKIAGGEQWYLIKLGDDVCGHFSYSIHSEESLAKFEKSFFKMDYRGQGIFNMLLDYVESIARSHDFDKVTICTNIRNQRVIDLVGKAGFIKIGQEDIDIGDGYFMSDYFFEKPMHESSQPAFNSKLSPEF